MRPALNLVGSVCDHARGGRVSLSFSYDAGVRVLSIAVEGVSPASQLVVDDALYAEADVILPEVDLRVTKPNILGVVLRRGLQVRLALDVISARSLEQERILQVLNVGVDRVVGNLDVLLGLQGARETARAHKRAGGGAEYVEQRGHLLRQEHVVAFDNVAQVRLRDQVLKVAHLRSLVRLVEQVRHAAVGEVLLQRKALVPA